MSSARSGMSIGIVLMLILSSLLMVLTSPIADAQTSCDTEINALRSAIESANFTNEKDRTNLLLKVDAAEAKFSQGKTQDAVAKIQDIQSAVEKLAAGGKLDQNDANAINEAAKAAITCLEGTSSA